MIELCFNLLEGTRFVRKSAICLGFADLDAVAEHQSASDSAYRLS